jgi:hypothetical protein
MRAELERLAMLVPMPIILALVACRLSLIAYRLPHNVFRNATRSFFC